MASPRTCLPFIRSDTYVLTALEESERERRNDHSGTLRSIPIFVANTRTTEEARVGSFMRVVKENNALLLAIASK